MSPCELHCIVQLSLYESLELTFKYIAPGIMLLHITSGRVINMFN